MMMIQLHVFFFIVRCSTVTPARNSSSYSVMFINPILSLISYQPDLLYHHDTVIWWWNYPELTVTYTLSFKNVTRQSDGYLCIFTRPTRKLPAMGGRAGLISIAACKCTHQYWASRCEDMVWDVTCVHGLDWKWRTYPGPELFESFCLAEWEYFIIKLFGPIFLSFVNLSFLVVCADERW